MCEETNPAPVDEFDGESYDKLELDDGLLLEPVGVVDGEFKLKINGAEYGYKPNPANYQGDMAALEKEFLYKMTYPGRALAWLKGVTLLTSRPGGAKVLQAPSSKSKVVHTANVKSSSGDGEYVCNKHDDGIWTCTCPHHVHRGAECKHIKSVQDQLNKGVEPEKIAASATGESKKNETEFDNNPNHNPPGEPQWVDYMGGEYFVEKTPKGYISGADDGVEYGPFKTKEEAIRKAKEHIEQAMGEE